MHHPMESDGPNTTAPTPRPLTFTGSGGEYFGIWMVNTLMTVLTLGIYSAWAKVRKNRYFYGNTWLDGHNFEYHANPLQILKGRLIAVAALIGYVLAEQYSPIALIAIYLVFLCVLPWIIVASLRFKTRMSSYRTVRFDFTGTVGNAAKVYLLYPVLAAVSFLLLLPWAGKRKYEYVYSHYQFGSSPMKCSISLAEFYKIYGQAILLGIISTLLILCAVFLFMFSIGQLYDRINAGNDSEPVDSSYFMLMAAIAYFMMITSYQFLSTKCFNHAINHTVLDGRHGFLSRISPWKMIWITTTNILAVIFSLGLLYPWTVIRTLKYRLSSIAMISTGDLSEYASQNLARQKATGEGMADIFDVGVGV